MSKTNQEAPVAADKPTRGALTTNDVPVDTAQVEGPSTNVELPSGAVHTTFVGAE